MYGGRKKKEGSKLFFSFKFPWQETDLRGVRDAALAVAELGLGTARVDNACVSEMVSMKEECSMMEQIRAMC